MATAVADGGHDLEMDDSEGRDSVQSPTSSYSTYSHEVKYIFHPVEEDADAGSQYSDYSHIAPRTKQQSYMSHTPRTLSATSQLSGKENRTPNTPRDDSVFDMQQCMTNSRTNSVLSGGSRDRCPISPRMEEALYSSTHFGQPQRKPSFPQDHASRDRLHHNSSGEIPPYPTFPKPPYSNWKNNEMNNSFHGSSGHPNNHNMNNLNNARGNQHYPPVYKPSNVHKEAYHKQPVRTNGYAPGPPPPHHGQHPLTNVHNYHHYQQPHVQQHKPYPEPPYPDPPRYNHMQHARRKTWSPPALKLSLLQADGQARVCQSNDSLDTQEDAGIERRAHSLSEDLDVTPPRLAPISGVLSQKPGPNLIKPIAFKPIHASPDCSPLEHVNRWEEQLTGSQAHEFARLQGTKLGTGMLGVRGSPDTHNNNRGRPGAFNSTSKPLANNAGDQNPNMTPNSHHHSKDNVGQGLHQLHQFAGMNTSHSSASSSNLNNSHSYCNIPANSQHNLSANSAHLSGGDEQSFSADFPRACDRPDSVPSLNTSRTVEGMRQTPSPSDSGVGELEAMLREKDAEINTLREVMDRNERAIFQVYEERRHVWLHDTQELRDDYERKLKIQSRKSYKTEQVLSLQVYKLQQEQKSLQEEKAKIGSERDALQKTVEENKAEIAELRDKLAAITSGESGINSSHTSSGDSSTRPGSREDPVEDESGSNQELARKNKELITLKSQLHSFQVDAEKKNKEVSEKVRELSAKSDQIKSLQEELNKLRDPPALAEAACQTHHAGGEVAASENVKPSMMGERERTISGLQEELAQIRAHVTSLKDEHELEREQWLDEKNKVVRYQKQLQLNYVQMQRKNQTLETEVQQLTLELENRDMKLIALSGEESVC